MARPNRKSQEFWFDTFADMPLADQAAALKILEQVHRLAARDAKHRTGGEAERNGSLDLDGPDTERTKQ